MSASVLSNRRHEQLHALCSAAPRHIMRLDYLQAFALALDVFASTKEASLLLPEDSRDLLRWYRSGADFVPIKNARAAVWALDYLRGRA